MIVVAVVVNIIDRRFVVNVDEPADLSRSSAITKTTVTNTMEITAVIIHTALFGWTIPNLK